jgi:hypothetical protein
MAVVAEARHVLCCVMRIVSGIIYAVFCNGQMGMQRSGVKSAAILLFAVIGVPVIASAAPLQVNDATVCGLLSESEVSAATKGGIAKTVSITFVTPKSHDVTCAYKSARSVLDDVLLVISEPRNNRAEAGEIFSEARQLKQKQAEVYKKPLRDLAGLGDSAFWDQPYHDLFVLLKGRNLVVRVNAPTEAIAQTLAQPVVTRLIAP